MKALVLAALLLPPTAVVAVSPEDAYLAARDRYIASFKTTASAKDEKAAFARHDKALRDLEQQLKSIVGPFSVSGFPAEGKLNLVSLFPDDIGFGMLDGLVYGEGESAKSIVVTTDRLLDKWLFGHRKRRSKDIPTSAAAAVKTEDFYAQAVNSELAAANYGEIPVAAPPGAKFAYAMLSLIGNGPLVPGTRIGFRRARTRRTRLHRQRSARDPRPANSRLRRGRRECHEESRRSRRRLHERRRQEQEAVGPG